jgi:hypothetical protein
MSSHVSVTVLPKGTVHTTVSVDATVSTNVTVNISTENGHHKVSVQSNGKTNDTYNPLIKPFREFIPNGEIYPYDRVKRWYIGNKSHDPDYPARCITRGSDEYWMYALMAQHYGFPLLNPCMHQRYKNKENTWIALTEYQCNISCKKYLHRVECIRKCPYYAYLNMIHDPDGKHTCVNCGKPTRLQYFCVNQKEHSGFTPEQHQRYLENKEKKSAVELIKEERKLYGVSSRTYARYKPYHK